MQKPKIRIVRDVDQAIAVMHNAGKWLNESGKKPSKWWQPKNLNRKFLLQHAEPSEFYVLLLDKRPAAAAILQDNQRNQNWARVDKGQSPPALYVHWLCVDPQFTGRELPKRMVDFAAKYAKSKGIGLLRADTNAQETKLRRIYEDLEFHLVSIVQEDYRKTAFYQKNC